MQGLLHEVIGVCQVVEEVCLVYLAVSSRSGKEWVRDKPAFRNQVDDLLYDLRCQPLFHQTIRFFKRAGYRKQDMLFDRRKRVAATREVVPSVVMKVE